MILPGGAFAGVAEVVTDPVELDRAWRALSRAFGLLGRAFVGAPDAEPDELLTRTANLPVVRIRPVGIAAGPADPGGWLWATLTVVGVVLLVGHIKRTRKT